MSETTAPVDPATLVKEADAPDYPRKPFSNIGHCWTKKYGREVDAYAKVMETNPTDERLAECKNEYTTQDGKYRLAVKEYAVKWPNATAIQLAKKPKGDKPTKTTRRKRSKKGSDGDSGSSKRSRNNDDIPLLKDEERVLISAAIVSNYQSARKFVLNLKEETSKVLKLIGAKAIQVEENAPVMEEVSGSENGETATFTPQDVEEVIGETASAAIVVDA